jgi:hypothetical protein
MAASTREKSAGGDRALRQAAGAVREERERDGRLAIVKALPSVRRGRRDRTQTADHVALEQPHSFIEREHAGEVPPSCRVSPG